MQLRTIGMRRYSTRFIVSDHGSTSPTPRVFARHDPAAEIACRTCRSSGGGEPCTKEEACSFSFPEWSYAEGAHHAVEGRQEVSGSRDIGSHARSLIGT
jgi:hypothetical protein